MGEWRQSNHRAAITTALALLNLAAIGYALYKGGPERWDYHFRHDSFITWLGSAQMLGAALLFLACHFAGSIIHLAGEEPRDNHTWLVFAVGFLLLALDQQFLLREHITAAIDRVPLAQVKPGGTTTVLKAATAAVAIVLVVYYRATVLSNFFMVVAFVGGFWFLLVTILGNMLVEAIGLPAWASKVMEGSGKLLAMAMFLSGSYIALLDRLWAAQAAADMRTGDRRKRQIPISFPDRRGRVEFRPLPEAAPTPTAPPDDHAVPGGSTEEEDRDEGRLPPLDRGTPAPPQAPGTSPSEPPGKV